MEGVAAGVPGVALTRAAGVAGVSMLQCRCGCVRDPSRICSQALVLYRSREASICLPACIQCDLLPGCLAKADQCSHGAVPCASLSPAV